MSELSAVLAELKIAFIAALDRKKTALKKQGVFINSHNEAEHSLNSNISRISHDLMGRLLGWINH